MIWLVACVYVEQLLSHGHQSRRTKTMKIHPEAYCAGCRVRPFLKKIGFGGETGSGTSIRALAGSATFRRSGFSGWPRTWGSLKIRGASTTFSRQVLACLLVLSISQTLVPRPAFAADPEWVSKYY